MEYLVNEDKQQSLATERDLDQLRIDRDRLGASYQTVKVLFTTFNIAYLY